MDELIKLGNIFKDRIKGMFFNPDVYHELFDNLIMTIFVLVGAYILNRIIIMIIDALTNTGVKAKKLGLKINNKRSDTLRKLIHSIVRYAIYFIAFIEILSLFGIKTTGVLASAGLVSVAIGFGAQTLVKDIITGFFIILEGQFDVGDHVRIHNQSAFIAEGSVIELSLRSTKIIANSGEVYYIPNSSINQVINYSKAYSLATVELEFLIKDSYKNLEMEINNLLSRLNISEKYVKNFYKKETLKIKSIKNIGNNVAKIDITVKTNLKKNELVETMIKQDFFEEFKERLLWERAK